MFTGNRGRFHKIVTALFGVVLTLLVVKWIYETGAITAVSRHEAERNTRQYAADAQERIERDCLKREALALTQCIREVIEASNEHQRSEDDLVAQGDMALWAFWMVVVSLASVGATAIGVVYVALTLREARKTTQAATDGAEHGRVAAEQARISNELAAARAERQFDPYLFVTEAKCTDIPEDDLPAGWDRRGMWIKIVVKNGSNWPAFVKEKGHHAFRFVGGFSAGSGGGSGTGGTHELKAGESTRFVFGSYLGEATDPSNTELFVGVQIVYETLEGRRRTKDFWFERSGPPDQPAHWRLKEIHSRPVMVDDLPDMQKGLWRTRKGMPTVQDFQESAAYDRKRPRPSAR